MEQQNIYNDNQNMGFQNVVGIITADKVKLFNKMIFRVTRGNAYFFTNKLEFNEYDKQKFDIQDELVNDKYFFMIYISQSSTIYKRVIKALESMEARM